MRTTVLLLVSVPLLWQPPLAQSVGVVVEVAVAIAEKPTAPTPDVPDPTPEPYRIVPLDLVPPVIEGDLPPLKQPTCTGPSCQQQPVQRQPSIQTRRRWIMRR